MCFFGRAASGPGWRALRLSCTPPCALALTTVSASLRKVTAWAGSRSSTKTRMNTGAPHRHRPSKVARYLTGPRSASTFRRSPPDSHLLDLQVGKGLRLDRKPVSEAVALRLPSFVVRVAELG